MIVPDVSKLPGVLIFKVLDISTSEDETTSASPKVGTNHPLTQRHIPEEQRSHLHNCESLQLATANL